MEQYNVKLHRRAVQDLDGIYTYIAQTLMEPETALKLIDRLEDAIFSLETLPYRRPERRTGSYACRGYRQLLIENYTIIFQIDEARRQVLVVTVRYSSRA